MELSAAQAAQLDEGIALFNAGQHWHAHEAWEHLWLSLDGDDKRFAQGLIMAAAMLVQYGKGIHRGVTNHHANTVDRLAPHREGKWGIDVSGLLDQLAPFAAAVDGSPPVDLQSLKPGSVHIDRDHG